MRLKQRMKLFYDRWKSPLVIEIHLTDHCNLNCIGCSHYSPLAPDTFCDLSELERNVRHLAAINKHAFQTIRLLGGEPLLNPDIEKACEIVRISFKDVNLQIVTNGILLPKMPDTFWKMCHNLNIDICITTYPIHINLSEIKNKSILYGVTIREYGDRNDTGFRHDVLDPLGRNDKYENHRICHLSSCLQLYQNKIYPCGRSAYIHYFNTKFEMNFAHEKGDYLEIDKIKYLAQIKLFRCSSVPFCRYCSLDKASNILWSTSKKEKSEWM